MDFFEPGSSQNADHNPNNEVIRLNIFKLRYELSKHKVQDYLVIS